jgi:hypothetical protein
MVLMSRFSDSIMRMVSMTSLVSIIAYAYPLLK